MFYNEYHNNNYIKMRTVLVEYVYFLNSIRLLDELISRRREVWFEFSKTMLWGKLSVRPYLNCSVNCASSIYDLSITPVQPNINNQRIFYARINPFHFDANFVW